MVPTHFYKPFSIVCQYLFNSKLKDFNTVTNPPFSKIIHRTQSQNTSAKLSLVVKNKIWTNKWLNLEFPFNTLCTFWPNSILFQGVQNRFHNSILSIPRGNPVISKKKRMSFTTTIYHHSAKGHCSKMNFRWNFISTKHSIPVFAVVVNCFDVVELCIHPIYPVLNKI